MFEAIDGIWWAAADKDQTCTCELRKRALQIRFWLLRYSCEKLIRKLPTNGCAYLRQLASGR